ncbi:MAG TPA: alpha-hydroxy acid oxidase [Candidatus Acidoferrales bacterium]|nr:alpha-hydroxy acid oxidase [Candidatus Acidoferrales bacterium]
MGRFYRHDVINIADLRRLARGRVPRVVFDYIDGGADDEVTLRENERIFDDVTFRPRTAVVTPSVDLSTTVLGAKLALPFILAPVGSTRLMYPRGEALAARAATTAGTAYTLSTLSGTTIEEVRRTATGTLWYQLYVVGGRAVAEAALARATAAGFTALLVTVDTPVAGLRERDIRNGTVQIVSRRPLAMLPFIGQFLARPAWLRGFLADGGLMRFPNVVLPEGPMPYAEVGAALETAVVSWPDLKWIREAWRGSIVVKGMLTAEDARRAVDEGADGIVVSNHGGRQLDGAPATLRVLPEIVRAVGGRTEVLMDGGIRRGSDIAKALCLGAKAVLVGRAYAYGLAAGGEPGVARAIDILRTELTRTMKLLGCKSVSELDGSWVNAPDW